MIVLFDSECPLCVRFKQALSFLDSTKKIEFVSVHEKWIYAKYSHLNYEECLKEIHILTNDKRTLKGSEAIEFIVSNFPAASKFAWLIETNSGKNAINYFYKKVNDLRQTPGCRTCGKKRG